MKNLLSPASPLMPGPTMMKRRRFLSCIGTIAVPGFMTGRLRGEEKSQAASGTALLDRLREEVHRWTASLWDAEAGGFRRNQTVGANLLSSTDVAWLRYAVNDPDLFGGHRGAWIRYLQGGQDPETGRLSYGPAGQGHPDGHAMWHTVRTMNILGGQLLHLPHYLREVITASGLEAWFDAMDWNGSPWNHHEVMGLVPLLVNLGDTRWTETFYAKIAEQQNPENGCFPQSKVSISRTFAYTALHRAVGRMPPRADKIVDTVLALQNGDGFWEDRPSFHTMDAAYILILLPGVLNHRQVEARQALERLRDALLAFYSQNEERIKKDPHWMLAMVHSFGLLQEAFPGEFPSQRPYRFDWDKPSMYRWPAMEQWGPAGHTPAVPTRQ